jgi:tRNA A37 threonylcarbamoyladenosine dehydratase
MEQFTRTKLILGEEKFKKLHKSRVTVLGLGAVGGYVVEGLARAGVSHLRLVDFDTVKPSNLNRQILALHSTVGQAKAELAKTRVLDINPKCNVEVLPVFISEEEMPQILDNGPDLVIDAIDSLNPKVQALFELHRRGIPCIASMGAALRTDPFAIKYGDLFHVRSCPLAKAVRGRLRRRGITEGIYCVYSHEICKRGKGIALPEEHDPVCRGRTRNTIGSLPTIPALFGLTIAHIAIDRICGGINQK